MAMITNGTIDPISPGDRWQPRFEYLGITDNLAAQAATMALLNYQWDSLPISQVPLKEITSTNVSGTGQIEDTGSIVNGRWRILLRFDFFEAQTALLTPGKTYYYYVKVVLADGSPHTLETGSWPMVSGAPQ